MQLSIRVGFIAAVCVCGCQPSLKEIADQHVEQDLLAVNEKQEAISFLEENGVFFDDEIGDAETEDESTASVDQEIVLPLLKQLRNLAGTEQWAMIRPDQADSAYGILIGLPHDSSIVESMASAIQEADDKFSGFILQQWGNHWLLFDFIDQQTYEFLKRSNPNLEKQR